MMKILCFSLFLFSLSIANDSEVVSGTPVEADPAHSKGDLNLNYEFKELTIDMKPLSAVQLCKKFYGETAKPGVRIPFENSEELLAINCYNKGNNKARQIPIEKETLAHFDSLQLQQACKSSTIYSDYELAEVIHDPRPNNDLQERYFKQDTESVKIRCRRPFTTNAKSAFHKTKTQDELFLDALQLQKINKKKKNLLRDSIEKNREEGKDEAA